MTRLVIAVRDGLLCAAMDSEGGVSDLHADKMGRHCQYGAVVQARVAQLLPGQGAAIMRWDEGGAAREAYWSDAGKRPAQSGDMLCLQVKTAAWDDKLPQLSYDIALPGRFLLHLPHGNGVKLSRRCGLETAPACLAGLPGSQPGGWPGGWIVRAAASASDAARIAHEADYLRRQAERTILPAPLCWQRAVIEHGAALRHVIVEDNATEQALRCWLADFAPDLLPAVTRGKDALDWDALLTEATVPGLDLTGGGRLTLERTRAFWAVDVDAGAAQNHLQVNIQAGRALARQMRLRNWGGIVVADFISLKTAAERAALLAALKRAVADDPAGVEIFGISKLGLVEMTRPRRAPCLADLLEA